MKKFLQNIFSIKNKDVHKVVTILGIKLKFKNKKLLRKLKPKEKINFKTFKDLSFLIRNNIFALPADLDLIVGIPRSGIIPAYMIALFLNKNVCSLNEFINNLIPQKGERPIKESSNDKKKILIVDDSINTGRALNKTKEQLQNIDSSKYDIKYCCIFATNSSKNLVDYYFEILEQPRIFQWNYLNHTFAKHWCFDMDGVLCVDPTEEQNDDGEKYIDFILNARPLYIPTYTIHSIVTSRLEKYRPQTEEWLKKHNVKYKNLYMLNLPSAQERRKRNCHADFKADIYKKLKDCTCFIESNHTQAIKITKLSKKPCICVETDEIFGG